MIRKRTTWLIIMAASIVFFVIFKVITRPKYKYFAPGIEQFGDTLRIIHGKDTVKIKFECME